MAEAHGGAGGTAGTAKGYAQVGALAERMGGEELLAVFAEGDGYASHALVDDVELVYECANGATFEHALFRDCLFEQIDFRDCTFRDAVFEDCRLSAAPWTRHGSTASTCATARRRA